MMKLFGYHQKMSHMFSNHEINWTAANLIIL